MRDPNLAWAKFRHSHAVSLGRRIADIRAKHPEEFGHRRAEVVIDAIYSVASWLRKRSHIAVPVRSWRWELIND